jgi:hypothetical protein
MVREEELASGCAQINNPQINAVQDVGGKKKF